MISVIGVKFKEILTCISITFMIYNLLLTNTFLKLAFDIYLDQDVHPLQTRSNTFLISVYFQLMTLD